MSPVNRPYVLASTEGRAMWYLDNLVTIKAAGAQTRGPPNVPAGM